MCDQLPKISITRSNSFESSEYSASENDKHYDRNSDCLTDIEDLLDSNATNNATPSRRGSCTKLLPPPNPENDVTDIEDFNESEAEEEEKSKVYPELKMSLHEFLSNGLQEQASIYSNTKQSVEIMAGNFLKAQNLNGVLDAWTDCEDYNTDSEIEESVKKSVCVELDASLEGYEHTRIIDKKVDYDSDECHNISEFSDISNAISALSDGNAYVSQRASEDELWEVSGDEEVCQIEYSGSSYDEDDVNDGASNISIPAIDVMFCTTEDQARKVSIPSPGSFKTLLDVTSANEEVLTDIERLDDSAAEDDSFDDEEDDIKPIPRAVILASEDDGSCLTDIEDISCESSIYSRSDSLNKTEACNMVAFQLLPPVHREVIALKEHQYGDTISSVMPMEKEFKFGIYSHFADDELTDTEEYSCADECDTKPLILPDTLPNNSFIDCDFIVSSDTLKQVSTKRFELQANAEALTDVEEIFLAGTNRRKKLKSRSLSKGKSKVLEIKTTGRGDSITDVEDMDLSDAGQLPDILYSSNRKQQQKIDKNQNYTEMNTKVTDIEDITDDSTSDVPDIYQLQIDPNILNLTDYVASGANTVHSIEYDGTKTRGDMSRFKTAIKADIVKKPLISEELTDSEDIQMTSDADVDADEILYSAKESTCSFGELNEMLNESCTVVHEKHGNSFDVESEKLHIKSMVDCRDAHTDIEYVESDESLARGGN